MLRKYTTSGNAGFLTMKIPTPVSRIKKTQGQRSGIYQGYNLSTKQGTPDDAAV